jgi:hypothetical protein
MNSSTLQHVRSQVPNTNDQNNCPLKAKVRKEKTNAEKENNSKLKEKNQSQDY